MTALHVLAGLTLAVVGARYALHGAALTRGWALLAGPPATGLGATR